MADKPAQICQLEKGKLIDTQDGFVDTFNWVAQSMANLEGGENCEVSWTIPDHPTIDVTMDNEENGGGGGGVSEAVYDVIADTDQEGNNGITVEYTDDRADSFIPFPSLSGLSSVYDVVSDTQNGEDGIKVEYNDGRQDSFIPFSAAGGIIISADTNQSTGIQTGFKLESKSDSNIKFTLNNNVIQIGAYYI